MRFAEVQGGARWTQLVVEMMDACEGLLADVTDSRSERHALLKRKLRPIPSVPWFEAFGRKNVRRGKHRPPAQRSDSRLVEHGVVALRARRFAPALGCLHPCPAPTRVRIVHTGDRPVQPLPDLRWQLIKKAPVRGDRFKHVGGCPHTPEKRAVARIVGLHGHGIPDP